MTEASATALRVRGGLWTRLRAFLGDLLRTLREAKVPALASQVAYSLIFAMPSILLIVAVVVYQIDLHSRFAIRDEVRRAIMATLPPDVQQVVGGLLDDAMTRASVGPTTISAIISILVALIMAGNGFGELSAACCTVRGVEDTRPMWLRRALFTAAAVLIAMILIGAFTLFIWGGDLVRAIGGRFGATETWAAAWDRLQLPALLLFVFLGILLLYMTGTGHYVFWQVAPGALVATALWLLAGKAFQLYLQFTNPGTAYGAASSALVFLVFLYVSAIVLIIGGMIAAVIARGAGQAPPRSLSFPWAWRRRGVATAPDRDAGG